MVIWVGKSIRSSSYVPISRTSERPLRPRPKQMKATALRPSFTHAWPCIASPISLPSSFNSLLLLLSLMLATSLIKFATVAFTLICLLCCRRRRPLPLVASSPPSLPLPLLLRPPEHTTTVSDLLEWHSWAKSLAASVGSSFEDSDNGRDSTLLCRELNWLVEDVLHGFDPSLMREAVARDDPDVIISSRADVQELYGLWKQRMEERRPFQYIVGCEHWRDLILCVRDSQGGVLIPRPESEIIVDLVGDVISKDEGLREALWADLGTGSGAIAIGIAKILGNYGSVIATDLSPVAVQVASFNVERYTLRVCVIDMYIFSCRDGMKQVTF